MFTADVLIHNCHGLLWGLVGEHDTASTAMEEWTGWESMLQTTKKTPAMEWLPWASLNLHRNPFGELTPEERAELAVVDVDHLIEMLRQPMCAVQFIGQCGRGKTTRMLKLRSQLRESSYTYIPERPPCPPIGAGNPVLIDEAQRLSRAARHRVFASGCSLILATHRDLSRILRKYGYRIYTEHIGEGNSPQLVLELLNRRIEASRLRCGSIPQLSLADAEMLVAEFGSDIRSMENELYAQFQRILEGGTDGEV